MMSKNLPELHRLNVALRESERRYRELVEHANSIIFRMDIDGHVTYFNEFAQRFFGYTEEEILGQSIMGTIVPERDSENRDLAALIAQILQQQQHQQQ